MIRGKNILPKPQIDQSSRERVAAFFGLKPSEVSVQPQADTFSIFIADNAEAQEKYKTIAPWGNDVTHRGAYNFRDTLLVMWNGRKIQPV